MISFYNKVAQDWKQDGSYIQMRLPDSHSAVTSQQQLDRITGTVQRMMEVELEESEMWLALCELDIECYVSSYNPSYIAQALKRLMIQPKMKREMEDMMRRVLGRITQQTRACCVFYRPWGCLFHPGHATRPCGPWHLFATARAALPTGDW